MNMFGWESNSRVRVRTEEKEEWIFIEGNYVIPLSFEEISSRELIKGPDDDFCRLEWKRKFE